MIFKLVQAMSLFTKMIWIGVVSLLVNCGVKDSCFGHSHMITTNLYNVLFANYQASLLPSCYDGEKVTLRFGTAIRQIIDLNEREQILTLNLWMRLKWNDCRLKWNATDYANVSNFQIPYSSVWVPDIALYDSAAEEDMLPGRQDYRASVSSDGSVSYNFPTVVKSVCRVDVTYFPYDRQNCSLQFGSWSHHGLQLDIVALADEADKSIYNEHNEWTLEGAKAIRHELKYACCPEPYPDLTFYVSIRRKSQFYVMTVLFPCILTSIVAMLGFILPVESGEKVSLGVTVLLSLAVFLLLVSESLPASSDNFPYIGQYFACSMVLVSFSCFMTVLVLNLHFRGEAGRKVPSIVRKIVIQRLGKILCVRGSSKVEADDKYVKSQQINLKENGNVHQNTEKNTNDHQKMEQKDSQDNRLQFVTNNSTTDLFYRNSDPVSAMMREQTKDIRDIREKLEESGSQKCYDEWMTVAQILDRLFFVLYVILSFFITVIFIGIIAGSE